MKKKKLEYNLYVLGVKFMNEKIKYYLLTFIRYFGDSFFYPFFSLYLYSKENIAESKVGILVALTPLIGLLANPLFSKICKNFKTTIIKSKNFLLFIIFSLLYNY